jgi:hypothetical protein
MRRFALGLVLTASLAMAQGGKLMHCFYFTPVDAATTADWEEFYKATAALPGKIPGLNNVWFGKLRRPLSAGGPARAHGVCMEMDGEAALKTYAGHPAHTEWVKVYSKVRQEGTTTVDIIGR